MNKTLINATPINHQVSDKRKLWLWQRSHSWRRLPCLDPPCERLQGGKILEILNILEIFLKYSSNILEIFLPGSSVSEAARWQDPWNLFEIFLKYSWNILAWILLVRGCKVARSLKSTISIKWNSVNFHSLLGILNILRSNFVQKSSTT